jgi:hypothetical protein
LTVFVLASLVVVLGTLWFSAQSVADRSVRLFRLATAPDTTTTRFSGEGAIAGEVYQRPGVPTLLVVTSNLPPLADDERYEMWFLKDGKIYENQRVRRDADGVARTTLEMAEPGFYDEITITREREHLRLPTGPVIARWTRG